MKSFNIHRFWLTLKWDARTNFHKNLRHWLIMVTLFFFAILLPHACVITDGDKQLGESYVETISQEEYEALNEADKKFYTSRQEEVIVGESGQARSDSVTVWEREWPPRVETWETRVETQHTICAMLLLVIVMFYFTYSASLFLNNLKTKQQRISFLSLPASRTEKLLVRFIYAVPVWFLMVLSAFIVGDLLRYAVQPLIGSHYPGLMVTWLCDITQTGISDFVTTWSKIPADERSGFILAYVITLSSLLQTHSTYILGSSLFPRFPWLITTGIIMVVSSVLSIVMVAVGLESEVSFIYHMNEYDSDTTAYLLIAFNLVVSILFYVLAVIVFRRMQVINHKFINL